MAYLGNQPSNNFVSLKRQVITGNNGSSYTLDHSVASVNDVAIFVNNVRQDPASYSISGTALTLGGTISSSDSCYVIFLGQALQTVTPDANTITNAMLQSGSFSNITGTGTLTGLTLSDNILFNTASKGIYLGVTSATASNLLDDYEEGTWTPTAYAGTSTLSVNGSQSTYTKIGRVVTVYAEVNTFGTKSSSHLQFNGLPFTPASTSLYMQGTMESDGGKMGIVRLNSNTGRIIFYRGGSSNGRINYAGTELGNGARFSLTYFAA